MVSRRRALGLALVAPLTLVPVVEAAPQSQTIDTRPTFKRSEYVMLVPNGDVGTCIKCNGVHYTIVDGRKVAPYTTNGHATAWPIGMIDLFSGVNVSPHPVSDDAVPYGLKCNLEKSDECAIHYHHDFRWVD